MEPRIDYAKAAPDALAGMLALQKAVDASTLERPLLELVRTRASQMNACAYCIDMHTKDARALGESEQRLFLLPAWRESPFYSPRERAALAWTEALTDLSTGVPDDAYALARAEFTEKELAELTYAVATINAWNRIAVALRSVPGRYRSRLRPATSAAGPAAAP